MESDYRFKLTRRLTVEDVEQLLADTRPKLALLIARYGENLPLEDSVETDPLALDFIRTKWFLDKSDNKPTSSQLTDALWPAFGSILAHRLGMVWCEIEDNFGTSLSMLSFSKDPSDKYQSISVPPLSYVQKRESVPNAEIFVDAVELLKNQLRGACA